MAISTVTMTDSVAGRRPARDVSSAAPWPTRLTRSCSGTARRAAPTKGHVMTGVDTIGYNIAWFSPKPMFTERHARSAGTSTRRPMSAASGRRCCSSSPLTPRAIRRDAPTGEQCRRVAPAVSISATRHRIPRRTGRTTASFPKGGTLAGLKDDGRSSRWFQNQDTLTAQASAGRDALGRAGSRRSPTRPPGTRTASRTSRTTRSGHRRTRRTGRGHDRHAPARSRRTPVRVVFQDDNYDPPKDDALRPERADLALGQHPGRRRLAATSCRAAQSASPAAAARHAAAASRVTRPTRLSASPTGSLADADAELARGAAVAAADVVGFGGHWSLRLDGASSLARRRSPSSRLVTGARLRAEGSSGGA